MSIGNYFQIKNFKKTNNAGFLSDIDYLKNKQNICIIGDSYVEAKQVSNSASIGGLVNNNLFDSLGINAYSFGVSGSQLSQYLGFAKMAKDLYNPLIYVFVIVGNDFDESHISYLTKSYFHYYDENYNLTPPTDYQKPSLITFFRKSAFIRYFTINNYLGKKLFLLLKDSLFSTKDIDLKKIDNEERYDISYKCIDQFLIDLKKIVSDKPVVFLIDGQRTKIYRNDNNLNDGEKYVYRMKDYLINSSLKYNFNTINLDGSFKNHYAVNRQKFNFDIDYHWNELGHQIATNELLNELYTLLN